MSIQRTEIADDFHMPLVHPDYESSLFRYYPHQPSATRREVGGRRRSQTGASGQYAYKTDDIRSRCLSCKMILGEHLLNFAALADNDFGNKRKFAFNFGACSRVGHSTPDNERARRADVDGTEVLEFFGQLARSEGPVTSDVDSSQENNECHSKRLNDVEIIEPPS